MKKLKTISIAALSLATAAAMVSSLINPENLQGLDDEIEVFDGYSSLDGQRNEWGIKKNKNAPPEVPAKIRDMLKKHDAFYMDNSGEKKLYLTFDEGYENGYTASILDTLKESDVKAAFFVTMPYLEKETELVKRMVEEGHTVGNHTMNHPDMTKLSSGGLKAELTGLDDKFFELFAMHMKYMRPPEGVFSERVIAESKDLGYTTVFWSFAYRDWDRNVKKGADSAYNSIVPYIHDGAILLLHAVSADNAAALPRIINYAKGGGYTFCSLDELMTDNK